MEVLYPRCCGLDVHKSSIAACALLREQGRIRTERRRFTTMTQDLQDLAAWLRQLQVTHVAIESTGVYWKPVWNILEGHFTIILANAQHVKNVPGRKTDAKDSEWIAELVQHGLLRSSYVPPEIIRDLRDLTRGRATLSQEASRIASRIQKVLEDANIKLSSVASNTLGKSGRAMLDAIVAGQLDPEQLADLALGHLRAKIPQLQLALSGKVREHHRFLLKRLLHQWRFIENEIDLVELGAWRRRLVWPWSSSQRQLTWRAGPACCPGNCESAGKHLSGKTRKGSPWLGRMACQCAWAAARTKNTYLSVQFRRLAAKRGKKRAIIAVAHSILVIAYHLQRKQCDYRDLGHDYFDRLNADGLKRYLISRLEALGHKVTIEAAGDTA